MTGPLRDRAGFEELAARIRRGDAEAEEEVVRLFAPRVNAMTRAGLHQPEDREELVDDVLMAVLRALRRGTVRGPGSLPAFVHGTALRLIQNRCRRLAHAPRMREATESLEAPDVVASLERADEVRACRLAIELLATTDRQILSLTLEEGLKPGEIASRLGLSAASVRQRKRRAIKRLLEEARTRSDSPTTPMGVVRQRWPR